MIANSLRPLEPYPGAKTAWLCECMKCGALCSSRLTHAMEHGHQCGECGKKRQAAKIRLAEDVAVAMMREAGLEPLEPYPGAGSRKWRCRCGRCGAEVAPRLGSIRRGFSGCIHCGHRAIAAAHMKAPEEADRILREAGFIPLEPYRGIHTPIRTECLSCGDIGRRTVGVVMAGHGCHCSVASGFDPAQPALVYVLFRAELDAVKIGISQVGSQRIGKFTRRGWSCFNVAHFSSGWTARMVERLALAYARNDLGLAPYLAAGDMAGIGGHTETFSYDELPPWKAWELVRRFADPEERLRAV